MQSKAKSELQSTDVLGTDSGRSSSVFITLYSSSPVMSIHQKAFDSLGYHTNDSAELEIRDSQRFSVPHDDRSWHAFNDTGFEFCARFEALSLYFDYMEVK